MRSHVCPRGNYISALTRTPCQLLCTLCAATPNLVTSNSKHSSLVWKSGLRQAILLLILAVSHSDVQEAARMLAEQSWVMDCSQPPQTLLHGRVHEATRMTVLNTAREGEFWCVTTLHMLTCSPCVMTFLVKGTSWPRIVSIDSLGGVLIQGD